MKFFLPGVLLGAVLSFFLFKASYGGELYYDFYLDKEDFSSVSDMPAKFGFTNIVYKTLRRVIYVNKNGSISGSFSVPTGLYEMSGDGKYYISYESVGSEIELKGFSGERFWKIKSMEKPFLSYSGKMIFLLNGDHSKLRIIDRNSNPSGTKEIAGRLCTSVVFSQGNDTGAVGFADGSFHFVNSSGEVIYSGHAVQGAVVKSLAVSNSGEFGAVHYGDTEKDFIRIIQIKNGKIADVPLKSLQRTRAAISVNDKGETSFFDTNRILLMEADGDILFEKDVPAKRTGFARLNTGKNITVLSYGRQSGGAQLYIFRNDGTVIYSKTFSDESFLDSGFVSGDDFISLRGQDSLFAYSLSFPD